MEVREVVRPGLISKLSNLILAGVGLEQRMIDHAGHVTRRRPRSEGRRDTSRAGLHHFVKLVCAMFGAGAVRAIATWLLRLGLVQAQQDLAGDFLYDPLYFLLSEF